LKKNNILTVVRTSVLASRHHCIYCIVSRSSTFQFWLRCQAHLDVVLGVFVLFWSSLVDNFNFQFKWDCSSLHCTCNNDHMQLPLCSTADH